MAGSHSSRWRPDRTRARAAVSRAAATLRNGARRVWHAPLPATAVALLCTLAAAWLLIGAYTLRGRLRARKREK